MWTGRPQRQAARSGLGREAWPGPRHGATSTLSLSPLRSRGPGSDSWLCVRPFALQEAWGAPGGGEACPRPLWFQWVLLTKVSFAARFSPLPPWSLGGRAPLAVLFGSSLQDGLRLLWAQWDLGIPYVQGSQECHGTRKSRVLGGLGTQPVLGASGCWSQ